MVLTGIPDPDDPPCPKIAALEKPETSRPAAPSLHRPRGGQNKTRPQLHLQSRCLPCRGPGCRCQLQAGQAYRNQTSSSKGSYQKSTFGFSVAFHVPLDKTQRKRTSVSALSFSLSQPTHWRACLPSGPPSLPPSFLLAWEKGWKTSPSSKDQQGLDCPLSTGLRSIPVQQTTQSPQGSHGQRTSQGPPAARAGHTWAAGLQSILP